ncbi:MAG: hypothetical protein ABFS02_11135 [Pseudomonadota bacterium]
MTKINKTGLYALLLSVLSACGTAPVKTTVQNDFPTITRVEYVLQCMQKHGGQRYDTLYPCVCSVDKLASKMTHEEYESAKTFTYLSGTPGEAGGIFRDPPEARKLRKRLEEAEAFATGSCFVK